ncbi:MAG: hypothetical protein L3J75_17050 [Methylococcaceae bacterium]|nr:hypothetical protein [Methylococcaceae bacterium]
MKMKMKTKLLILLIGASLLTSCASVKQHKLEAHDQQKVTDQVIENQRHLLLRNTEGKGFGPQSPRDIELIFGNNSRVFNAAPLSMEMNLCNIHFHKNAEHKGGEFTKYAGNGDGHGYQSGYKYSGHLTEAELTNYNAEICPSNHGSLSPGDTIEVHYVYSTAQVKPGPTLGSCLSDSIKNPQLRVETQIYVLVNDKKARDFGELTQYGVKNNLHQALGIPIDTGTPIQYAGSTTGPSYTK